MADPAQDELQALLALVAAAWGAPCALETERLPPLGLRTAAAVQEARACDPCLSLPVRVGGEIVGTLHLGDRGVAPTPQRLSLAQAAAGAVAEAMQTLSVNRALQERLPALEEARLLAEGESRSREEIVRMLGHDLRSPLSAMLGWVHMLQSGGLGPEQHADALGAITRSARLQGQLIGDVADLARLMGGQLPVEWTAVDTVAVARDAVEAAQPLAHAKMVALEFQDAPGLPASWADPRLVAQVARLLLGYAIKLAPSKARVVVSLAAPPGRVVLSIAAAGAGLSAQAMEAVFAKDPGHERSGAPARQGGVLAVELARRLIDRQGGTLDAESEGPRMRMTLRVSLAAADADRPDGR